VPVGPPRRSPSRERGGPSHEAFPSPRARPRPRVTTAELRSMRAANSCGCWPAHGHLGGFSPRSHRACPTYLCAPLLSRAVRHPAPSIASRRASTLLHCSVLTPPGLTRRPEASSPVELAGCEWRHARAAKKKAPGRVSASQNFIHSFRQPRPFSLDLPTPAILGLPATARRWRTTRRSAHAG